MIKSSCKKRAPAFVIRVLACALILIWLGNSFPPSLAKEFFHDDSCQMACCQGMARHSANSCSGGMCHTKPIKKEPPPEKFCGANDENFPSDIERKEVSPALDLIYEESAPPENSDGAPRWESTPPNDACRDLLSFGSGSGAFNFSGRKQQQNSENKAALISIAARPRPPTALALARFFHSNIFFNFKKRGAQISARAPPTPFRQINK